MKKSAILFLCFAAIQACQTRGNNESNEKAITATKTSFFGLGGKSKVTLWAIPNDDNSAQCWYQHTSESEFSSDNENASFVRSTAVPAGYVDNKLMADEVTKDETLGQFVYSVASVVGATGLGFAACGIPVAVKMGKTTGGGDYAGSFGALVGIGYGMAAGAACGSLAGGYTFKTQFYDKTKVKEISADEIQRLYKDDPDYFRKVDYAVVKKLTDAAAKVYKPSAPKCPAPTMGLWSRNQRKIEERMETIKK